MIRERYPDHGLMGEESLQVSYPSPPLPSPYSWSIDPIDGTTNYINSLPLYTHSVACCRDGVTLAGCVYNPSTGEMYLAAKGDGAYKVLAAGTTEETEPERLVIEEGDMRPLSSWVVNVGFPAEPKSRAKSLKNIPLLAPHVRGLRMLASAAMTTCLVAEGRLQGYVSYGLYEYDYRAARLVLEEAGGEVRGMGGGKGDLMFSVGGEGAEEMWRLIK